MVQLDFSNGNKWAVKEIVYKKGPQPHIIYKHMRKSLIAAGINERL